MACECKCCCGCCCTGSVGDQSLEASCTGTFHGKGTICDVCCDLGEIREDITTEEDCPGTWVPNGRCLENPCVGGGVCCLPDDTCTTDYATQEECEACDTSGTCEEYLYQEDPEAPCPEGWYGGGGYCYRSTQVASCQDCAGYCYPNSVTPCGTWRTDIAECDECVCKVCPCDGTPTEVTVSVSGTEINHPILFCAPWSPSGSSTASPGWNGGSTGAECLGASPAFIADGCERNIVNGDFRGSFLMQASLICSKVNGQATYSMCAAGNINLVSNSGSGTSSSYYGCQSCSASGGSITLSPLASNAGIACDVTITLSVTNNPLP